jgi:hypothetical protein
MKCYIIIPALALTAGTLAFNAPLNAHDLQDLAARSIDPQTMDPTRLSILSVLKTAMPSGLDVPEPTGSIEPEWYKDLPENVKSLLPILYPHVTSVSVASVPAETGVCSFESVSETPAPASSPTLLEASTSQMHPVIPKAAVLTRYILDSLQCL